MHGNSGSGAAFGRGRVKPGPARYSDVARAKRGHDACAASAKGGRNIEKRAQKRQLGCGRGRGRGSRKSAAGTTFGKSGTRGKAGATRA